MSDIIAFANLYKIHNITLENVILHAQNIAVFSIGMMSFLSVLSFNLHHNPSGEIRGGGILTY